MKITSVLIYGCKLRELCSSAVSVTLVKKNINEPQSAFWVQNKKLLSASTITEINQNRPKSELVLGNIIQIYDSIHVCWLFFQADIWQFPCGNRQLNSFGRDRKNRGLVKNKCTCTKSFHMQNQHFGNSTEISFIWIFNDIYNVNFMWK